MANCWNGTISAIGKQTVGLHYETSPVERGSPPIARWEAYKCPLKGLFHTAMLSDTQSTISHLVVIPASAGVTNGAYLRSFSEQCKLEEFFKEVSIDSKNSKGRKFKVLKQDISRQKQLRAKAKAQYKFDQVQNGRNEYDVYRSSKGLDLRALHDSVKLFKELNPEKKKKAIDRAVSKQRSENRTKARSLKECTLDANFQMRRVVIKPEEDLETQKVLSLLSLIRTAHDIRNDYSTATTDAEKVRTETKHALFQIAKNDFHQKFGVTMEALCTPGIVGAIKDFQDGVDDSDLDLADSDLEDSDFSGEELDEDDLEIIKQQGDYKPQMDIPRKASALLGKLNDVTDKVSQGVQKVTDWFSSFASQANIVWWMVDFFAIAALIGSVASLLKGFTWTSLITATASAGVLLFRHMGKLMEGSAWIISKLNKIVSYLTSLRDKHIHKKKWDDADVGEADLQSIPEGFIGKISSVVTGLLSVVLIGTAKKDQIKTLLSAIGDFPRVVSGLSDIMNVGLKFVERITNTVRGWLGYDEALNFTKTGLPDVDSWLQRAKQFIMDFNHGKIAIHQANADRLQGLIFEVCTMLQKTPQPLTGQVAATCAPLIPDLRRIMDSMSGYVKFQGARPSPLCIMVMGASGVGKSAAVYAILNALLARVLPMEDMELFIKNPQGFIYARQFEHKFWDGYHGQFAVVFDDLGQAVDAAGTPDSEFMDLIRCVSIFENTLHKAAISDKGNTSFSSKVILVTTNFEKFEPNSINLPEAIHRRFDVVHRVVPAHGYVKEGTDQEGIEALRLKDMDKFDVKAWRFLPMSLPGGKEVTSTASLGWDQYIDVLEAAYNKKMMASESLRKGHNEMRMAAISERYNKEGRKIPDWALPTQAQIDEKNTEIAAAQLAEQIEKRKALLARPLPKVPTVHFRDLVLSNGPKQKAPALVQPEDLLEALPTDIETLNPVWKTQGNDPEESPLDKLAPPYGPKTHFIATPVSIILRRDWSNENGGLDSYIYQEGKLCSRLSDWWMVLSPKVRFHLRETCLENKIEPGWLEADSQFFVQLDQDYLETKRVWNLCRNASWAMRIWYSIGATPESTMINEINHFVRLWKKQHPHFEKFDMLRLRCERAEQALRNTGKACAKFVQKHGIFEMIRQWWPLVLTAVVGFITLKTFLEPSSSEPQGLAVSGETLKHPKQTRAQRRRAKSGTVLKGSMPGTKLQINVNYCSVKAGVTQLQMDNTAIDIGVAVCRSNLFELILPEIGRVGLVLFVEKHTLLVPFHYCTTIEERISKNQYTEMTELKLVSVYDRKIEYRMVAGDLIKPYGQEGLINNELALIKVTNRNIPQMRNIVEYFCPREYLEKEKDRKGYLVIVRDEKPAIFVADRYVYLTDINLKDAECGTVEIDRVIKYPIPTLAGDCGGPFFQLDATTRNRKILGIHIAGDAKSFGLSGLCSLEDLKEGLSYVNEGDKPAYIDPIKENIDVVLPQGVDVGLEGKLLLKKDEPVTAPNRTAIIPSVLHNTYFQTKTAPAALRPVVYEGVLQNPMDNGIKGYTRNPPLVPDKLVQIAADKQMAAIVRASYLVDNVPLKRLLSMEEAIKGIEGCPEFGPVNRKSSAGYKWSNHVPPNLNGKHAFFGMDEWKLEGPHYEALIKEVNDTISDAVKGIRRLHVYTDHLKDERRKWLRVLMGKTRIFSACPLHLLLVFRIYFGAWMIMMIKGKIDNGCAVGVNTHGADWDILARQLKKFNNFMAGDYEGFDQTLMSTMFQAILKSINQWYDDGEENAKVREMLFLEITNSRHIRAGDKDGIIYEWHSSMPSGNPLTALINSVYQAMAQRIVYYNAGLEASITLEAKTKLWDSFDIFVFVCGLGDDHATGVDDHVASWFNMLAMQKYLPRIGMKYTTATKEEVKEPFIPFDEVTFLKRSFLYDPVQRRHLGALDLDTILETACWTKRGPEAETITKANVQVVLSELSLHPQKVWDEWMPKITQAVQQKLGVYVSDRDRSIVQARTLNTPFVL